MRKVPLGLLETCILNRLSDLHLEALHISYIVAGLTTASLRGVDTHGVELLPVYIREFEEGRSNKRPNIKVQKNGAIIKMHADNALGLVAGRVAIAKGMDVCQSEGLALVSVSHSNHFGMASIYTLLAAKSGYVCLGMSHTDALVAPSNGAEKLLGTNPLSFAAPANNGDNFCLDMASSQVSFSAVQACVAREAPLQKGWAIDSKGRDSSENQEFYALQPLGGYKGQGLAMMVTVLAGMLSGMPLDFEMHHLYSEPYSEPRLNGHFFLLIDPNCFVENDFFRAENQRFIDRIRNCKRADKEVPVRVPGDLETNIERDRMINGIPISDSLSRYLDL